jgi:cholesterol transport system auxiliary component
MTGNTGTSRAGTWRGRFFLLSISLVAAGCVSSKPAHYYTIEPPAGAASQSRPDGPVLVVADITTPPSLQDGRIRYRVGPNEAGAYEYHRWTERPGTMVRNSLLRALRASGKYQRVIDSGSASGGDYLLSGRLLEFDEVDNAAIQTRISLHLQLIDKKTGRNVWDHLFEHQEPVSSKTVKDVVESLDHNLQQVVNDASGQVDGFISSRR